MPAGDERVCFIPFPLRGLGFPIHTFFQVLLHFYGLQLHHLTPNGVIHIACFVALCELFSALSHFWPLVPTFLSKASNQCDRDLRVDGLQVHMV